MFELRDLRKAGQHKSSWLAGVIVFFSVAIVSSQYDANAVEDETTSAEQIDQLATLLYQSSISAAEKSLRLHELRDARRWLDHAPEKLRGWEWRHLNAQCDESVSAFPVEHVDVTAIDVSRDGKRIVIATAQGDVTLYNLPAFDNPQRIGEHTDAVYSVVFSDDSSRIVTVSRDVTSRVWDVMSGKQISQIKLDNPGVAEACFSPSGAQVATCTWMMTEEQGERKIYGTVWIWDAETGEVVAKSRVGVKPLDSIQWSNDGTKIVVGSWDGLVHVLDDQARILRELTVPVEGAYTAVISVAISNSGDYIAAGSKDRTARVWRVADGELVATMIGHEGFVNALKFLPDDRKLVTASVDGTCRVWDALSGEPLQVLHGHIGSVTAIDVANDGQQLFSLGRDKRLRVWDLSASYDGRMSFRLQPSGTYTTTFSPDGKRMYIACYDGHVRVVDAQNGALLADWVAHESSCNSLSLSQDGSKLLTCSWDKTAKVWNSSDGRLLKILDVQSGVYDCALSADGSLAGLCVGNELQVWGIETGEKSGECKGHQQNLSEVAFSPNGEFIVTSATGEPARIWNAQTRELIAVLGDESHSADTAIYSHDGNTIATGRRGIVNVWNSNNRELQKTISCGDSPIHQLSFSSDDSRIAVASDAVYVLDPVAGESLLRFQPNDDDIYFLAFSPDGSRLATCTTSGSIAISESEPINMRLPKLESKKDE